MTYDDCSMSEREDPQEMTLENLDCFQEVKDVQIIRDWGTGIAVYDPTHGWWHLPDVKTPQEYIAFKNADDLFFRANKSVYVNGLHALEVNPLYVEVDQYCIPINLRYADGATAEDLDNFCTYVKSISYYMLLN